MSQVRRILAAAYLRAIMTSADAVRLRFSMLRDSIWFFTVGVIIEVSVWVRALTNEWSPATWCTRDEGLGLRA